MQRAALKISERDFQQQVVDLARLYGWMEYHTWNSIHSRKGFPDLVAIRSKRLIYVELKGTTGKLSEEQRWWLSALEAAGQEVYAWWPKDWETIVATLRKP